MDQFGQWTRDEWLGKVKTEGELVRRIRAEVRHYAEVRLDPARFDRFGGDKSLGIKSPPADKFRFEKTDGRWWFITPEGNPFLMIAVDGASLDDPTNMNTVHFPGKADMARNFEWIPPRDGKFANCWMEVPKGWWNADREGILRFDFFKANAVRAFGEKEPAKPFLDLVHRRLVNWGFNSLGKWNGPNAAA